jgi:hypothetical protein
MQSVSVGPKGVQDVKLDLVQEQLHKGTVFIRIV